jgi:putative tryptophan/tyrosine transport system substrate-binding protein
MRRRELIAFASGVLIFPSVSSLAQAPPKTVRLGILQTGTREEADKFVIEPFLGQLAKLGYVEGQNLIVERRYGDGILARLPALAAEIIALRPDLVFAPEGSATRAVKALTTTIPIVFCFVSDPVALGFAQSLAHPGGNLTGMSNFSVDIAGKRVELLKELVPGLTRLAIWNNPEGVSDAIELKAVEDAATKLGMQFLAIAANKPAEYEAAATATREWGAHAVYLNINPAAATNRKQIIALMAAAKLPMMYFNARFVAEGGLICYAANFPDLARRSATYAAKIFDGAKPADLPIEQPVLLELAINMKTAQALGLLIPPLLLVRATEVIE